jgi:hypothetical protein
MWRKTQNKQKMVKYNYQSTKAIKTFLHSSISLQDVVHIPKGGILVFFLDP